MGITILPILLLVTKFYFSRPPFGERGVLCSDSDALDCTDLIGILMVMFTPLVPRILRNTAFSGEMAKEIESLPWPE